MQHRALIEALGGPTAVAAIVGVDHNTPAKWSSRGIPVPHWSRLIRAAAQRGIAVDFDMLEAAAPQISLRRRRRPAE